VLSKKGYPTRRVRENIDGGEGHERPVMGDLNIIAGGFSSGGVSSASRKKYAPTIMHVSEYVDPTPAMSFMKDDLRDVFPHDNDPIVISIIIRSRRIHSVGYQGSLVYVLFWEAFVAVGGSLDELEPYNGILVGLFWRSSPSAWLFGC